jgi:acyl transferase domain-containing protein
MPLLIWLPQHGTGTLVGDPLEVSAIGRLFSAGRQKDKLLIGAVR